MQQHENFRHQHICCGMRCRFQKSDKNCTQFTYFQRNNRFIFQRPQIITIKAVFLRKKMFEVYKRNNRAGDQTTWQRSAENTCGILPVPGINPCRSTVVVVDKKTLSIVVYSLFPSIRQGKFPIASFWHISSKLFGWKLFHVQPYSILLRINI